MSLLPFPAGLPQIVGINDRAQAGVSYHFGTKYDSYKGWEGRYGFEVGVNSLGFQFKSAMTFYDFEGGGFDQRNNMITIGSLFVNFKYENDYMFNLMLGLEADGGDRYRTAAGRLSIGYVNIGFNLYTGDPGLYENDRYL